MMMSVAMILKKLADEHNLSVLVILFNSSFWYLIGQSVDCLPWNVIFGAIFLLVRLIDVSGNDSKEIRHEQNCCPGLQLGFSIYCLLGLASQPTYVFQCPAKKSKQGTPGQLIAQLC
jgi:hypothetical protein